MTFIDTHTHLYLTEFKNDIDQVIKDAIESGVTKLLLPNIDSSTTESMLNLSKKYPDNCFPMIGIHPCSVKEESIKSELMHLEMMLLENKFLAIGEIGLDLYWEKTSLSLQQEIFTHQIELAIKYELPIVIHVREAFDEAIKIVEKLNCDKLSGVFHCFTGNEVDAKRIIALENFYLGVGGVLTFKNSGLDKVMKTIPLNNILLETDSPYLAPTPFRGKRNESKYIVNIAKKLALIKDIEINTVRDITTLNANNLFKI
ncbi:MAG: TatD family hydrolase [Flavobacteriales bacterium]|jgi:TatD DNase family protein|nr:TatD family hydrolase [Flavobacteriales bacterium]|tara:strand:+ start:7238 stop:8011 length:774 start_codon:yes stop_codon:yes gene_type:complete